MRRVRQALAEQGGFKDMSDWYWYVIVAALLAVAFAPSLLKGRCPGCGKRRLCSVDLDESLSSSLDEDDRKNFLSFYLCEACGRRWRRQRSQPLEDASGSKWERIFQREGL